MTWNKINISTKQVSVFLILCSLLLSNDSVFADNQSAVTQLGNGVVVGATGELVFTTHPKAGIQATNVLTGDRVWKSAAADRPVSVSNSVLLAQVEATKNGSLELVYLEASTGQPLSTMTVSIPDDTRARVTDSMDNKFSVRVMKGGDPERLYWQNTFKKVQGAQLSRDEVPVKKVEGFLVADFSSRTIKTVKQPSDFRNSVEYRAPMPASAPGKRALYSQDLQHIVTSVALSAKERSSKASGARYQWHVYTTGGNKVVSFASAVSFAPFVVVRDKLLYVTPLREFRKVDQVVTEPMSLLAVDLTTGNQAYKVAIRDARFRGPFPP